MKDYLQKNARTVSTILVALVSLLLPSIDIGDEGLGFFELIFSNLSVPVGMALMMLLNWIGDRKLWEFTKTPAFMTTTAILITLAAALLGDISGVFVDFLTSLQNTGYLGLGSLVGLLVGLFGDKNIPLQLDTVQ